MSRCRCNVDLIDELILRSAVQLREIERLRDELDAAQRDARGWQHVATAQKATIERLMIAEQGDAN